MFKYIRISILVIIELFSVASIAQTKFSKDRKVEMFERILTLSEYQRVNIENAHHELVKTTDSVMSCVNDAETAFQMCYNAKVKFHNKILKIISNSQLVKFVRVCYKPEVKAKTDYRISLMRETNSYTDEELRTFESDIFEYLMLEKIVYVRDKYDYSKQKNNISRLKITMPPSLKESLNIEKQKGLDKLRNGRIVW